MDDFEEWVIKNHGSKVDFKLVKLLFEQALIGTLVKAVESDEPHYPHYTLFRKWLAYSPAQRASEAAEYIHPYPDLPILLYSPLPRQFYALQDPFQEPWATFSMDQIQETITDEEGDDQFHARFQYWLEADKDGERYQMSNSRKEHDKLLLILLYRTYKFKYQNHDIAQGDVDDFFDWVSTQTVLTLWLQLIQQRPPGQLKVLKKLDKAHYKATSPARKKTPFQHLNPNSPRKPSPTKPNTSGPPKEDGLNL